MKSPVNRKNVEKKPTDPLIKKQSTLKGGKKDEKKKSPKKQTTIRTSPVLPSETPDLSMSSPERAAKITGRLHAEDSQLDDLEQQLMAEIAEKTEEASAVDSGRQEEPVKPIKSSEPTPIDGHSKLEIGFSDRG